MITEHGVPQSGSSAVTRARLVIIGAVVALAAAIGLVLGSVLVAGGAVGLGPAARYVPAGSILYLEARLDLPGEQRTNLRAVLERFPGLDPDDFMGEALAATLDEALADGRAPFDYSSDIAPWFDGTVAFALHDYPMNLDPLSSRFELPSVAGLVGVRDPAAATAFGDRLRSEMEAEGATFSSSNHDGVRIWTLETEPMPMPMSGAGFAYAVTDDQVLLGSGTAVIVASLEAASGGEQLADRSDLGAMLADLPDERVATLITDSSAMFAEMRAEIDGMAPGMGDALGAMLDGMPALSAAAVHFAPDAILVDAVSGQWDGPFAFANGDRPLAEHVPADAIAYGGAPNVGPVLEQVVVSIKAAVAAAPGGDQALAELDPIEGALGAELEELVSWIGGGAWAAGWDGTQAWGGLVLEAADPDAAERRLNQLGALAQLAAADGTVPIEVSRETVDGVELTTIGFGSAGAVAFGVPDVVVEFALDGDVALIGFGDRFVRGALALAADDSLAASGRYRQAVDRFGGHDNAGVTFVDLAALRTAVEGAFDLDSEPGYAEMRPNLEPFDLFVTVTRVDGDRVVGRSGLIFR